MIAIVDYGVGNLFSLKSSLKAVGADAVVTGDADALRRAERILLPGVGAFGDAAEKLKRSGLGEAVRREALRGKPLMGICLGMQLLFDESLEFGRHEGLHLLPGSVRPIAGAIEPGLKIPHIGWNALAFPAARHPIFQNTAPGEFVYFVHSFAAMDCAGSVIATTDYGGTLTAACARGSVCGCQFHPEKSGTVGLSILRAFCAWEGEA